jgi:hypothetical protein
MDNLVSYEQIIQQVLLQYINRQYANADIQNKAVFDTKNKSYCVISTGWCGVKRIHNCFIHVDIIDGLVWIQQDGTEEGIAHDLEAAGISKSAIVLGFQESEVRLYTEYAIA